MKLLYGLDDNNIHPQLKTILNNLITKYNTERNLNTRIPGVDFGETGGMENFVTVYGPTMLNQARGAYSKRVTGPIRYDNPHGSFEFLYREKVFISDDESSDYSEDDSTTDTSSLTSEESELEEEVSPKKMEKEKLEKSNTFVVYLGSDYHMQYSYLIESLAQYLGWKAENIHFLASGIERQLANILSMKNLIKAKRKRKRV